MQQVIVGLDTAEMISELEALGRSDFDFRVDELEVKVAIIMMMMIMMMLKMKTARFEFSLQYFFLLSRL